MQMTAIINPNTTAIDVKLINNYPSQAEVVKLGT
jgi:hypothetical protein